MNPYAHHIHNKINNNIIIIYPNVGQEIQFVFPSASINLSESWTTRFQLQTQFISSLSRNFFRHDTIVKGIP